MPHLPCQKNPVFALGCDIPRSCCAWTGMFKRLMSGIVWILANEYHLRTKRLRSANKQLEEGDRELSARTSRLAHLRRTRHNSCQSLERLEDDLGMNEYERLLDALDEADARYYVQHFLDDQPGAPKDWPFVPK